MKKPKQSIKAMARQMRLKFGKDKTTDLCKYRDLAYIKDGKRVWTRALQKALDENKRVYIPKGIYYVDRSIVLPSDREIIAAKNAEICVLKGVKTLLMRNADVIDGSYRLIKSDEPKTENILVQGGVWSEENDVRLGYGDSGSFDEENSLVGVTTCFLFSGVKNLILRDMTFKNTAGFAIQLGRCENFAIEKIRFKNCFADGVHVNGDVKNGVLRDISGSTGDDLVALNMYDWDDSTINNGALENVLVENVRSKGKGYKAFRIQTGKLSNENGEIDCYVKDLTLRKIRNIATFKMYLQTPAYKEKPENGPSVGYMENITFEDIEIVLNEPVDQMENYRNGDLVTGDFGALEIGSNMKTFSLKNIRAKINKIGYSKAHLITVGPKSSFLPTKKIEIFDPYVKCTVEKITYENVRVNGKKVRDLREELCEVSFPDDMYPEQYGSGGYGEVKSVERR